MIMSLYHFTSKVIQRSKGRSVVAAAAYRSGTKIKNEYSGLIHNYERKSGIVNSEIILPVSAPGWMTDRAMLWNSVEISEKRRDAQLAREIEFSLPLELDQKTRQTIAREFVVAEFVERGMIADINFHDVDGKNPHVHVLLSLREVNENGFGNKNRDWNKKDLYSTWRKKWEEKVNVALENAGIEERVTCESYATLGIEQQPQIHIGVHATAMERRGIETERGNINRVIQGKNIEREAGLPEITASNPHLHTAMPSPLIKGFWRRTAKSETRYFKKGTHEIAFIDKGNCLKISRQEDETLLAALKLANKKWGRVNVSGDEEYRKRCIRIALQEGISILVDGKEAKEIQKSEVEKAEKERQRLFEAEKAEKERQRVEAEEAEKEQKSDLATGSREKAIAVEAAKIAAKQQQLREQFEAAQAKYSEVGKAEPGYGGFGESRKHKIWAVEFEQQGNDRRRAWEALRGDMAAPDKGAAEVNHRLTPEFAHSEAEKVVEDRERREQRAQQEDRARKEREERTSLDKRSGSTASTNAEKVLKEPQTSQEAADGHLEPTSKEIPKVGKKVVFHMEIGDKKSSLTGTVVEIDDSKGEVTLQIGENQYKVNRAMGFFTPAEPAASKPTPDRHAKNRDQDLGR